MKKLLYFILTLLIIALLITGIVGSFLYINRVSILSNYLSQKMSTEVSIDKINVESGKITIEKVKIANPSGYTLSTALEVETIIFKAPFSQYFKRHIVLDEVSLQKIYIGIEFKNKALTEGNWTVLISNLDTNFTTTKPKEEHKVKKNFRTSRTVFIKKLLFLETYVDLMLYDDKTPRKLSPIEKIEIDNVSSEEGIPTEEITEVIVHKLMEQITSLKGITNMILKVPGKAVKTVIAPFSIFFGGSKKSNSD
ncbi:MAG: hypothetical protein WDZ28_05115 [Simkaniaceae bacterium]